MVWENWVKVDLVICKGLIEVYFMLTLLEQSVNAKILFTAM